MRLSRVVLPAPRNPVSTVNGVIAGSVLASWSITFGPRPGVEGGSLPTHHLTSTSRFTFAVSPVTLAIDGGQMTASQNAGPILRVTPELKVLGSAGIGVG